ncbi:MAG: LacI family DNA-binding transcriptional regulator [Amaricoccus sp.]|nr:LacI family DNA-binding transcriptional regulator [Amaricoccus sp.]
MVDVARAAGVSQATVSLALNGSPGARLSLATRNRVRRAAEALGYQFVRRGRRRVGAEPGVIAFVADELTSDPWMALAFDGARERAMEAGYGACLCVGLGDAETEVFALDQLAQQPLAGVIYGTILTRRVEPPPALFRRPAALLNCYDPERRLPAVLPADIAGGRTATERLIRAGRRRIGLICGQQGLDATRDRLKGYRQALASNDIAFDPELVRPGNWEPAAGYEGTLALMALARPADAIFCANDMMAVGCYDALRALGLAVPGDVSVVGFDDREIARSMRPPLTTLILPQREMGAIAAGLVIDMAAGATPGPAPRKVDCPLVERGSV